MPEEVASPLDSPVLPLDDVNDALLHLMLSLELQFLLVQEWIVLSSSTFDAVLNGEPYQVLSFLINLNSGRWLSRAGARTLRTGKVKLPSELPRLVQQTFFSLKPCGGVPVSAQVIANQGMHLTDSGGEAPFRPLAANDCEFVCSLKESRCKACDTIVEESDLRAKYSELWKVKEKKSEENTAVLREQDLNGVDSETRELVNDLLELKGVTIYRTSVAAVSGKVKPEPVFSDESEEDSSMSGIDENDSEDDSDTSENLDPAASLEVTIGSTKQANAKKKKIKTKRVKQPIDPRLQEVVHCPDCPWTGKKISLWGHARKVHQKRRYYCDYCGKALTGMTALLDHHDTAHAQYDRVICNLCDEFVAVQPREEFLSHYDACVERERNAEVKKCYRLKERYPFKCAMCLKKFRNRYQLQVHLNWHNNVVNLFCEECDFKTHSPFSMNVHRKSHKRDRGELGSSFFCHICAKEFSSSPYLKWHIAYAHEKKEDNIKCEHCGLNFIRRKTYVNHCNKEHSTDSKYECSVCKKRFFTEGARKKHESFHAGLPSLFCDSCGKAINKKEAMKANKQVLAGEKPYRCMQCKQSTARPQQQQLPMELLNNHSAMMLK